MHAAVRSGIYDIERFDEMSEYAKGMLVEYWRIRDKMEAWEAQKQAEEIESKAKSHGT